MEREELEKLRRENEELKKELEMIETFYGQVNIIKRLKFYKKYLKEKWKYANNTNNRINDTTRNNTICNNSINNTRNNENNNLFNGEKVEEEGRN